jgi:hypothetical protein
VNKCGMENANCWRGQNNKIMDEANIHGKREKNMRKLNRQIHFDVLGNSGKLTVKIRNQQSLLKGLFFPTPKASIVVADFLRKPLLSSVSVSIDIYSFHFQGEQKPGTATAKASQRGSTTTRPSTIWPSWNTLRSAARNLWPPLYWTIAECNFPSFQSQLIFAAIAEPQADLNALMDEASKFLSQGLSFGNRESMKKF